MKVNNLKDRKLRLWCCACVWGEGADVMRTQGIDYRSAL